MGTASKVMKAAARVTAPTTTTQAAAPAAGKPRRKVKARKRLTGRDKLFELLAQCADAYGLVHRALNSDTLARLDTQAFRDLDEAAVSLLDAANRLAEDVCHSAIPRG